MSILKTNEINFKDFNYPTREEIIELLKIHEIGERTSFINKIFDKEISIQDIKLAKTLNNILFLQACDDKNSHLMIQLNNKNMVLVEAIHKLNKEYHKEVNKRLLEIADQVLKEVEFLDNYVKE